MGAIRSLVNAKSLQLECRMGLREALLIPALLYSSERVLWKEVSNGKVVKVGIAAE